MPAPFLHPSPSRHSHWRGLLLGRLAAPAAVALLSALGTAPARAAGFLDPGPFGQNAWTGSAELSTPCPSADPASCYSFSSNTSLFLASAASTVSTLTSGTLSDGGPISFTYTFDPLYPSQTAYYTIGGQTFALDPSMGSTIQFTAQANDQLSFGIDSSSDSDAAFLSITNFSYTAVPAPLPLLGAGAAFGWIRRRRAVLRANAAAAATAAGSPERG